MYEAFSGMFFVLGFVYAMEIVIKAIPLSPKVINIEEVGTSALFFFAAAVAKYLG